MTDAGYERFAEQARARAAVERAKEVRGTFEMGPGELVAKLKAERLVTGLESKGQIKPCIYEAEEYEVPAERDLSSVWLDPVADNYLGAGMWKAKRLAYEARYHTSVTSWIDLSEEVQTAWRRFARYVGHNPDPTPSVARDRYFEAMSVHTEKDSWSYMSPALRGRWMKAFSVVRWECGKRLLRARLRPLSERLFMLHTRNERPWGCVSKSLHVHWAGCTRTMREDFRAQARTRGTWKLAGKDAYRHFTGSDEGWFALVSWQWERWEQVAKYAVDRFKEGS